MATNGILPPTFVFEIDPWYALKVGEDYKKHNQAFKNGQKVVKNGN